MRRRLLMQAEAAADGDLPLVAALLRMARLPTDDLTPALLANFVVLRNGARVVGVGGIEWNHGSGLLRSVAVAADQQGRGLGGTLVEALEAQARSRGADILYLLTTTAKDYFAGRGYRPASRDAAPPGIRQTAQFTGLCPASAAFMVKTLEC